MGLWLGLVPDKHEVLREKNQPLMTLQSIRATVRICTTNAHAKLLADLWPEHFVGIFLWLLLVFV